ncbi:hypothetical protein ES703_118456 [subsurface metagenome]
MVFRDVRAAHYQGHVHAVLVEVLLTQQAVTAHGQAVVPGQNDNRVLRLSRFLQRTKHPSDLSVHVRNYGVVVGDVSADFLRRSRPRRQLFVADSHLAVIKRMLRQEILRQNNLIRIVHLPVLLRRLPRVMRCRVGDVHKEGLVVLVVAQKPDGRIAEQLAGMLITLVSLVSRIIPGGVEIVYRNVPMIAHTAEKDFAPGRKTSGECFFVLVPLARVKGRVSGLPQDLRQGHILFRNCFTRALKTKQSPAAHQHSAAGHTHRPTHRAHNVGIGEGRAVAHQRVYIGRDNVFVTQRADCVEALVVGKEDKDVRPFSLPPHHLPRTAAARQYR